MNRKQRRAAHKRERSASTPIGDPRLARELGAAADHLRHGRLPEAAAALRGVLAIDSQHPAALHHLGLIEHRLGNNAAAADLVGRSLSARPDHADALSDLSVILRELGRLDEAIAAAERAIALRPGHARAHTNLGNLLRQRGRLAEPPVPMPPPSGSIPRPRPPMQILPTRSSPRTSGEALAACDRALALAPQLAEAQGIRAQALQRLGRNAEALTAYQKALALKPGLATLHTEIGNILRLEGRFDEAIAAHRRTIAAKPDCAEAWGHLAVTLQTLGRWSEAFDAYRKAIDLAPDFAEAYSNLGVLLQLMGKSTEAIAAYRTATRLNPRYGLAHFNLGGTLKDLERLDEAIGAFRQAIACEPDLAPARSSSAMCGCTPATGAGSRRRAPTASPACAGTACAFRHSRSWRMSADPAVHLEQAPPVGARTGCRAFVTSFPAARSMPRRRPPHSPRLPVLRFPAPRHGQPDCRASGAARSHALRGLRLLLQRRRRQRHARRLLTAFDRFVDVRKLRTRRRRGASTTTASTSSST